MTAPPGRKRLGSRILFRESVELGYQVNPVVSVSAILDHISNANLAPRNAGITSAGARLGVQILSRGRRTATAAFAVRAASEDFAAYFEPERCHQAGNSSPLNTFLLESNLLDLVMLLFRPRWDENTTKRTNRA